MEVRWEPAARPARPRRWVSAARVSMWRERGSSVSSQWRSSMRPRSAASSARVRTERAPSSMVRSKWGMPPTTSTPMSRARVRFCEAGRGAEEAVLGEGDELEVEVGGDLGADVEEGLDAEEAVVGGVDVAADGEEAHGDGPVAVGQRAVADFLDGGDGAELAPEGDAFEQRAGGVDAGEAVGEGRVHVEVGVDEGRGDEVAGGVDGAAGARRRGGRWRRWCRR